MSQVLELVDTPPPAAFDGLTRAAAALFATPAALIAIVEEPNDRHIVASRHGRAQAGGGLADAPLTRSLCRLVKRDNAALCINDTRTDPRVQRSGAMTDLGVIAYLGVPVQAPGARALGALCVIDHGPRSWCDRDVALLEDLARCVSDEILLRAHVLQRERLLSDLHLAHERLDRYGKLKEAVSLAVLAPGLAREARLRALLGTCRRLFGFGWAGLAEIDGTRARLWCAEGAGSTDGPGPWIARPHMRAQEVMTRGEILGPPPSDAPWQSDVRGGDLQDYAGLPVVVQGRSFGVIEMTGPQRRAGGFSHDELSVLAIAAMVAGVLMELGPGEDDIALPVAARAVTTMEASKPLSGFHEPEVEQLAGMPLERHGVVPPERVDVEG